MFWKRKKTDEFKIEAPPADAAEGERRAAFRISPSPDQPVEITLDGQTYRAINISTGGLALEAPQLQVGRTYGIRLQLPDGSPAIHTELAVVSIARRGICRCEFVGISILSRNAIQRYVLTVEKQLIRTTRRRAVIPGPD